MSLRKLKRKHRYRFPKQPDTDDHLLPLDVNLSKLRSTTAPTSAPDLGDISRRYLGDQLRILEANYAGRSMLLVHHALSISYLRRDTPHTQKAWIVFERMWEEQSKFLCRELSTRWLISALQTFFDHSPHEGDRVCGGIGFTYGNLIKIYEAERNAEKIETGPDPDRYMKAPSFPGIGGFEVGSDILVNLHRTIYDAVAEAELAGPVLSELLSRAQDANLVFQRLDSLAGRRSGAQNAKTRNSFG